MVLSGSACSATPPRWALLEHPHGSPAEPVARRWLGSVLAQAPEALVIERDRRGRPQLIGTGIPRDCSWSHSGERLLVALGEGMRIGADLERLRHHRRALDLARRFFTAAETEWLAGLDSDGRDAMFTRLWCAKEAVLKAHGHGLSFGLHRLRFAEHEGALALVEADPMLGAPSVWTLRELEPAPGYAAALAWRPWPADGAGEAAY